MGFRYYKRINLGKGIGLNLSKSGAAPSYRSKYGSIGSKAYSIRTGIRGLSYRGNSGKLIKILFGLGAAGVAALLKMKQ